MLICHLFVFFGEVSLKVFGPFFNHVVYFLIVCGYLLNFRTLHFSCLLLFPIIKRCFFSPVLFGLPFFSFPGNIYLKTDWTFKLQILLSPFAIFCGLIYLYTFFFSNFRLTVDSVTLVMYCDWPCFFTGFLFSVSLQFFLVCFCTSKTLLWDRGEGVMGPEKQCSEIRSFFSLNSQLPWHLGILSL